jgi:hypothetical protein
MTDKMILFRLLLSTLRSCALVLSGLALASCVTETGGPLDGQVVDSESGRPVSNGVVYGIWDGLVAAWRTESECLWAESSRLDAQGRFHLAEWRKQTSNGPFITSVSQYVFIYAPGYELTRVPLDHVREIKLKRFNGTTDQRFHQLGIGPCVPDESRHNVAIVYRMMADELEASAVTPYQVQAAKLARLQAAGARANLSKPTVQNGIGEWVNVDPNDQYPE